MTLSLLPSSFKGAAVVGMLLMSVAALVAEQPLQSSGAKGRVLIYNKARDKAPIFCDAVELAKMNKKRFIVVELAAGFYAFRSFTAKNKLATPIKIAPGSVTFLRMQSIPLWIIPDLDLVPAERAAMELRDMRYEESGRIRDARVLPEARWRQTSLAQELANSTDSRQ